MNERIPLAQALREAARELENLQPPPAVLAAAQAALARAQPAPRRRPAWHGPVGWSLTWSVGWSGAAACAVVLAGSALLMLRPDPDAAGLSASWAHSARASGFVPVAPAERWADADGPAWLVSAEMPSERLAALGLPYDPAHAGERVRAELLMVPSGEVLAVRLIR